MTKILLLTTSVVLLTACASPPSLNPALADCPSQARSVCKGDPQAPTVNINTNAKNLKASPYCVKANEGSQLVFRITPRDSQDPNTVEIMPKDPSHTWLAGTNSNDQNFIYIDVPNDLDPDEEYYYGIKTDSKCLDPRVNVEN